MAVHRNHDLLLLASRCHTFEESSWLRLREAHLLSVVGIACDHVWRVPWHWKWGLAVLNLATHWRCPALWSCLQWGLLLLLLVHRGAAHEHLLH